MQYRDIKYQGVLPPWRFGDLSKVTVQDLEPVYVGYLVYIKDRRERLLKLDQCSSTLLDLTGYKINHEKNYLVSASPEKELSIVQVLAAKISAIKNSEDEGADKIREIRDFTAYHRAFPDTLRAALLLLVRL